MLPIDSDTFRAIAGHKACVKSIGMPLCLSLVYCSGDGIARTALAGGRCWSAGTIALTCPVTCQNPNGLLGSFGRCILYFLCFVHVLGFLQTPDCHLSFGQSSFGFDLANRSSRGGKDDQRGPGWGSITVDHCGPPASLPRCAGALFVYRPR